MSSVSFVLPANFGLFFLAMESKVDREFFGAFPGLKEILLSAHLPPSNKSQS